MRIGIRGLLFVAGIIGMALGGVIAKAGAEWWALYRERAQLRPMLVKVVQRAALDLPRRIDKITTLVGVSLVDLEIIYTYRIEGAPEGTILDSADIRERLMRQTCFQPLAERAMTAGLTYRSIYFSHSNQQIFDIKIAKPDCQNSN